MNNITNKGQNDDDKFCIRECEREFIQLPNNVVKVYCPSCDRTIRLIRKKENTDFKDIE
jgi:hypothetical protein